MNSVDLYHVLSAGPPENLDVLPLSFTLHREGRLRVAWAPFDYVNRSARIALVGITPGWQQTKIAYEEAYKALGEGRSYVTASRRAKARASFAGTMRKNLVSMLDEIGVARALGIESTAELFGPHRRYLHTTSALRYPVFIDGGNYTGHSPKPLSNDYLRGWLKPC